MNLLYFCDAIFAICKLYGCSVTSWIRSREYNEKVGGLKRSMHVLGLAVHIVPDDYTLATVQHIREYAARFKLDVIDEITHLHIEPNAEAWPSKGGSTYATGNGHT